MTAFASKQTVFVRRVNVRCQDNLTSRTIEHFKSSELKQFLLCTDHSGGIKRCKQKQEDQSLTPTLLFDLYRKMFDAHTQSYKDGIISLAPLLKPHLATFIA